MSNASNNTASIANAIQLLPALRALEQHEKLYIIQFLAAELNREHLLIVPGGEYPVWSPYDSYEAAEAMLQAIKDKQSKG